MPRKLLALLVLAAGLVAAAPAFASGDYVCSVAWKLKVTELVDCDDQPFLSPGNDSRVNLQLLLIDAGKAKLQLKGPFKHADDDYSDPDLAGPSPFTLTDIDNLIVPPPPSSASGDDSSSSADVEGSRCNTAAAGADQFNAAMAASPGLPAPDRAALSAARAGVRASCMDGDTLPAAPPPVPVKSALGKQFAAYLAGAQAFYDGRYDDATQAFASLQTSAQPWLKETARYMLGRVAVNQALAGAFDQYGDLQAGKGDAKSLAAAQAGFTAYLHDYPNGAYAASARGLLRRVAWLGGRTDDLSKDYAAALVADPSARNVNEVDLVLEADKKLFPGATAATMRDPLLLASLDLMQMRISDDKDAAKPIDRATLEAQRPAFAGNPALFNYLLAVHALFDEKAPAAALALLPPGPAPATYLDFSRQVLRGMALEETGDHAAARALWLGLMPAARPPFQHAELELALAMNDERGGALEQVFAPASPIADPDLREILLRHAAGPALLRQQAKAASATEHERQVALYALLYKEVTRGRYQAFLADLSLMPPPPRPAGGDNQAAPDPDFSPFRWDGKDDDYKCPPLRDVTAALARDPKAAASIICLTEFVRVNELDDDPLDTPPPADELGGAPSQFPGGAFSRLETYEALLADPKTPPNVRAYTLYRAVECYGPSGYNHCAGKDVPIAQRKAWFQMLKSQYPSTTWAQELKYYW